MEAYDIFLLPKGCAGAQDRYSKWDARQGCGWCANQMNGVEQKPMVNVKPVKQGKTTRMSFSQCQT